MVRIDFNEVQIDRLLPPRDKPSATFWDTNQAGFGIRISKFRKTWIAAYTVAGGKQVMESLGTTDLVPKLDAARELAKTSIERAHNGINPVAARRQEAVKVKVEAAAQAMNFRALADAYIERYAEPKTKPRTLVETRRQLKKAAAFFGAKPARDLDEADIAALIEKRTRKALRSRTQGRSEADNCLLIIRRCLKWAKRTVNPDTRQRYIAADVSADIERPLAKHKGRDRVLDDHEIIRLWRGCDVIGYPFGPLIKLLVLTGQRRSEVAGMTWGELDIERGRVWHVPGARTKNSHPNDVHLSDLALAVIRAIRRTPPLPNRPDFVFTMTRCTPVSGFGLVKERLNEKFLGCSDWTLHDLRRTMTTGMARLDVRMEVAEKILNHVSGKLGGIAGIYNRFQYRDERKAALDQWAAFVADLTRLRRPERKQLLAAE